MDDECTKAIDPDIDTHLKWARGYRACLQLQAWREKGYTPQLHGTPDGWVLTLGAMDWAMERIDERAGAQRLRFSTAPRPTPEDAIEAALEVIRP